MVRSTVEGMVLEVPVREGASVIEANNFNEGTTIAAIANMNDLIFRTKRAKYINGAWRFHPSWQLRGSFNRNKFDYELPSQRVNNRNEDLAEAGGDYVAPSGSRIGLVARRLSNRPKRAAVRCPS